MHFGVFNKGQRQLWSLRDVVPVDLPGLRAAPRRRRCGRGRGVANHVLPTAGSARFFSPLGVYDFVKRTQFIQYSSEALASQADAIVTLAQAEGLDGHAEAIIKRVPAAKEV